MVEFLRSLLVLGANPYLVYDVVSMQLTEVTGMLSRRC